MSSLFMIPFPKAVSPAPTPMANRADACRRLRLATNAVESMRGVLERGELMAPQVLSALHATVIEVSRRTPSPLRVTLDGHVRIDAKATQLLELVVSILALLPPLLLESSLHPNGRYTRCASTQPLKGRAGAEESEEELHETAKGIAVRCLLVEKKVLPISSLQPCRTWCLAQTTDRGERGALALMGAISRPLEGLDVGTKRKWLLDTFDMLGLSSNLVLGLHSLNFACSAMAAGRLDAELLFRREIAGATIGAGKIPLRVLPHILAFILVDSAKRDESLVSAVGSRLLDLLKISAKHGGSLPSEEEPRVREARGLLLPALVSLRHLTFFTHKPALLLHLKTKLVVPLA